MLLHLLARRLRRNLVLQLHGLKIRQILKQVIFTCDFLSYKQVPTEVHVLEIDEKLMDTEFIGEKDLVFEQSNEISSDNNVVTLSNDKEESFDHYYKVMW